MTTNEHLALTHRSYSRVNNERLEFLGDSVLGMVVAEYVYNLYPGCPEGTLAQAKASLVCTDRLHAVAIRLGFGEFLLLGNGEEKSGGRSKKNILADAVEAWIGATYLDYGYPTACEWIHKYVIRGEE